MSAIVVDVGNTRIKWGRSGRGQIQEVVSLPPGEPNAWEAQWHAWNVTREQPWIVSGVQPHWRDELAAWLRERSDDVQLLTSFRQLPLKIKVEAPEKVGIDRLLNAVAANRRRPAKSAAVLVDAGSAVTVDYVGADGVFHGGAIFPGFRLMAHALHDYTALLPIVEIKETVELPGTSTVRAIQAGIYHAVLGGIHRLIAEYQLRFPAPLLIYLTGGDAQRLAIKTLRPVHLWSRMTLEGILHSAARSRHASTI